MSQIYLFSLPMKMTYDQSLGNSVEMKVIGDHDQSFKYAPMSLIYCWRSVTSQVRQQVLMASCERM